MKVAVRYYTKTGNTKRLAEAVAAAVGAEALPIDVPVDEAVDVLFLGNSYYAFSIDPEVREFIASHPTVYLSTHTPLGCENLEAKATVDLNNPPESKPVGEIAAKQASGKYVCSVCGYVYDPAEHDGVAFEDLPDDWKCPRCRQGKDKFNKA